MSRKKSRGNRMNRPLKQSGGAGHLSWRNLPLLLIALTGLLVYSNSFEGSFVFDDFNAIRDNTTIRKLFPLEQVLFPEKGALVRGASVEGRPLLNLSFALNHAVGGYEVWGYHVVNLLLHVFAGLALYGVVRRTMLRFDSLGGADLAQWLALLVALIWVVHPLQTESVTYIVQRAESLVGLLYLLALYCFIRGVDGARWWRVAAVFVCALGMTAKEVMATAPVVILIYDWVFLKGSIQQMWRERRVFYLALFSTWVVLAALLLGTGGTNLDILRFMFSPDEGRIVMAQTVGGTSWWEYALTQFGAVVHYLRLGIWPDPLIVDYGIETAQGFWEIVPAALMVMVLLAATVFGVWRRHWAGFVGVWFFLILVPTTSVIPTNQTLAEHRMYLPLAAVVVLLVVGGYAVWRRWQRRVARNGESSELAGWPVLALLVILVLQALALQTLRRNRDYRTQFTLLQDTVQKRPGNARAHHNLGLSLMRNGRVDEAMAHFRTASELKPDYLDAHYHLGDAMLQKGQFEEARVQFERLEDIKVEYFGGNTD